MSSAYSEDLRKRVIQSYEKGIPKSLIIILFNICMETLNRWIRQYKKTGNVTPKTKTKHRQRKFSDEDLLKYIELNSSATLEEIAQQFSVKPSSIYARLKKLGITRKKNLSLRRKK